jgi:hypothetical protein
MTRFGYTLTAERNAPKNPVQKAISTEHRGFDFEVTRRSPADLPASAPPSSSNSGNQRRTPEFFAGCFGFAPANYGHQSLKAAITAAIQIFERPK